MKRFFIIFLLFISSIISVNAVVLEAGVSIDEVPKALFGSWSVSAKMEDTNSPATFKAQGLDFWNLSRLGDTLSLDNPNSGANSSVSIKTVEGNLIVFSRKTNFDTNKVLTDTVTIRLGENEFSGINYLTLETFSLVDKHLMKTETARYVIKGEKVSGDNILK
jgi:hypothetical protein